MVKREVIRKHLEKLDEYLEQLKRLQKYPLETFLHDPDIHASTERYLQLAIETTISMGNHVIADLNLGYANWYSDVPTIFYENSLISAELYKTWGEMIGFRNILVHDYIKLDLNKVYTSLKDNLGDFEQIKDVFTRYL